VSLTPNPIDLCLGADLKSWGIINPSDTSADVIISRLITAMSREIASKLQTRVLAMAYTETRNGNDRHEMNFLHPRAFAVNSLSISGISVPASPDTLQSGYQFDEDQISVRGYPGGSSAAANAAFVYGPLRFYRGRSNVVMGYSAGWTLPNQANPVDWVTATSYPYGSTILPTSNNAGGFIYVATNANTGNSGGSRPAVFNQTPGGLTTDGAVTWANLGVKSMPEPLPDDITQAAIELCNLRMKERTHVGELTSVTPGGLNVSYFRGNMPPSVEEIIRHYKRVIPVEI
jgi:hypothetical protein